MASRRDELNAYTFSRRRTLAAFLRPSSGGHDEEAPKAVRAVIPSLVLGAVAVAGFGAYGLFKPTAPKGWQTANAIIVGKQSTTRYVMLDKKLFPVLNVASARLVLGKNPSVMTVPDAALNSVPHGPTIGIPYAPDTLPSATVAGSNQSWVVCNQPKGASVSQKVYVLGGTEEQRFTAKPSLTGSQGLYVQAGGVDYLVDGTGTAYQMDASMAKDVFPTTLGQPEQVSSAWLKTLDQGEAITQSTVDSEFGTLNSSSGSPLGPVGTVLSTTFGGQTYQYGVRSGGQLVHISPFAAGLLHQMTGQPAKQVDSSQVSGQSATWAPKWPQQAQLTQVNGGTGGDRTVVCGSYTTGSTNGQGDAQASHQVWAGTSLGDLPVNAVGNTSSSGSSGQLAVPAYVTPGVGELFHDGTSGTGKVYLLTDNGMKYPIQVNPADGGAGTDPSKMVATPSPSASGDSQDQVTGLDRLGLKTFKPEGVPSDLVKLLPSGPELDVKDALMPQGS
ncbi:type VII secretion protein EccB [Phaeacidiphilus oryzae]|uniref:type VII secretion protein EccB n=1 Tax=Phaeacidiphilus oryzae TaxID=348818 RepID=UPI00068CCD65|nr:type VII secretion protein EccB [Phaeacidiphilus oryzae]